MTETTDSIDDVPPAHDRTGDEWRDARDVKYVQIREQVLVRMKEENLSLPEFFIWLAGFFTAEAGLEDEGVFAEYVDRLDIWKDDAQKAEFREETFWFRYGPGVERTK